MTVNRPRCKIAASLASNKTLGNSSIEYLDYLVPWYLHIYTYHQGELFLNGETFLHSRGEMNMNVAHPRTCMHIVLR